MFGICISIKIMEYSPRQRRAHDGKGSQPVTRNRYLKARFCQCFCGNHHIDFIIFNQQNTVARKVCGNLNTHF